MAGNTVNRRQKDIARLIRVKKKLQKDLVKAGRKKKK